MLPVEDYCGMMVVIIVAIVIVLAGNLIFGHACASLYVFLLLLLVAHL